MKIIITENKFNEYINKFIGDYVNDYIRYTIDSYLIYSEGDNIVLEYDSYDGRLFIGFSLVNTISDMFGLGLSEARVKIKDWFENENGVTVKFTESDKIEGGLYFNNEDEDNNN